MTNLTLEAPLATDEIQKVTLECSPKETALLLYLLQKVKKEKIRDKLVQQISQQTTVIDTKPKYMSYTDFKTFEEIEENFGISNLEIDLFSDIELFKNVSEKLKYDLKEAYDIGFITEKERSELVIMPILKELWRSNMDIFRIFSGRNLKGNSQKGLKGECDFILSLDATKSRNMQAPIFLLTEAKKDDIETGLVQCAAQILGAEAFNQKRNKNLSVIFGCITTGREWQFIKYENEVFWIDSTIYYLNQPEKILGILQSIVDFYKHR